MDINIYNYIVKDNDINIINKLINDYYNVYIEFIDENNNYKILVYNNEVVGISHLNSYFLKSKNIDCGKTFDINSIYSLIDKIYIKSEPPSDIINFFEKKSVGFNWGNIITILSEKGKIKVRDTDHHYRDDSRNFYIDGVEMSVDSLGCNKYLTQIESELIEMLN